MIRVTETVMMRSLSFRTLSFKNGESESVSTPKRANKIVLQQSPSFKNGESESVPTPKRAIKIVLQQSPSFKNWEQEKKLEASFSFKGQSLVTNQSAGCDTTNQVDDEAVPIAEAEMPLYQLASPSPKCQLDECATKVQKMYKGYRTRRQVADAAVIAEESWWQALDYASFYINSVSFYHDGQPEKAVSRWSRAKRRLAKVGKGLSKDERAQKLAMQHWLEAIDPRHRYGHNLHFYYDVWFTSESTQPFFYWLDAGDGKKCDLEKCPRSRLQSQMIKYLGPKEREAYEVIVVNGRLIKKKEQVPVNTTEGSKWIFVLSTSRDLYVGQKKKGCFQHSSFLAGAATTAAGRLVAKDGHLQAIWPYSGHYKPTEANFEEFISFLVDNNVDLSNVKRCSMDEDKLPSPRKDDSNETTRNTSSGSDMVEAPTPKWSTGAGPRIGCVRDYPVDLQVKALEHVRLSPRVTLNSVEKFPIPSPRPSPNMRLSPHMTRMGFSPRAYPADLQLMTRDNGSPKIVVSPIGSKIPTPTSCRRLPPTVFPSPNIQLRLPSMKGRRAH